MILKPNYKIVKYQLAVKPIVCYWKMTPTQILEKHMMISYCHRMQYILPQNPNRNNFNIY